MNKPLVHNASCSSKPFEQTTFFRSTYLSNRSWIFYKLSALNSFAKFTAKQLCQNLFLIKWQAKQLLKAKYFRKLIPLTSLAKKPHLRCLALLKETLVQVFSCEFCKTIQTILKNLRVNASEFDR